MPPCVFLGFYALDSKSSAYFHTFKSIKWTGIDRCCEVLFFSRDRKAGAEGRIDGGKYRIILIASSIFRGTTTLSVQPELHWNGLDQGSLRSAVLQVLDAILHQRS